MVHRLGSSRTSASYLTAFAVHSYTARALVLGMKAINKSAEETWVEGGHETQQRGRSRQPEVSVLIYEDDDQYRVPQ